jgi:hypothetical protein
MIRRRRIRNTVARMKEWKIRKEMTDGAMLVKSTK